MLLPASGERCPKIGATSRSEYRKTAITTNVSANPELHTGERRRKAPISGKSAPISAVHPRVWWRKAAREKSQPFCSCTRIATPETASASGIASLQATLCSFPRTRPSSAAPASIIVCAHAPWATMWIMELV